METQSMSGKIFIGVLLSTSLLASDTAAQKIWESRKGCLRAQGNIAPGYLFSQKKLTAYITGEAELFFDDRAAFNGALWFSLNTTRRGEAGIVANHALFSGLNYHFLKPGRFDPFVGLMPGVAMVQADFRNAEGVLQRSNFSPAPLISANIGFNYYVGWFFHFFLKAQGVAGQTFGNMPSPARLDELKITGGLGWNIRAWKPKKSDTWRSSKN